MEEILQKIVDKRLKKIEQRGLNFGKDIPAKREVPIILPDFKKGAVICEIKRGSPSEEKMNEINDPVDWASKYIDGGADIISVLTEEDYFFGGLDDLMLIKKKNPSLPVLRKDFLLFEEEIDISYRAGADLILLIASILDFNQLRLMKDRAESLGLLPLIEVHNKDELDKIIPLSPKLIGINSRNLNNFKIDKNYAIGLRAFIDENVDVVFESGIKNYADAFFASCCGFNSILVGTSIVRNSDLKGKVRELKNGFLNGLKNRSCFYQRIFKKIYFDKQTVVKICGITNIEDAKIVTSLGTDIIGFIFADSPREISIEKAKEISLELGDSVLKVGVVVNKNIEEVIKAYKEGWIDAIQFHGDITNEECIKSNVCWYKAIRVKKIDDLNINFDSPLKLFDTYVANKYGGSGKTIDNGIIDFAVENNIDLYLAGGIGVDNIKDIIMSYKPKMIDVSSGLEDIPGKKDHNKVKSFFNIINTFCPSH